MGKLRDSGNRIAVFSEYLGEYAANLTMESPAVQYAFLSGAVAEALP